MESPVVRDAHVARYGADGVRGLFYGDASQFAAQLLGVRVVEIVGFGLAYLMFRLTNWIAPVRVATNVERAACDTTERGIQTRA